MKGLPKKNRHYVWVALGVSGLRSLGWAETVEQTPPWKAPESEIKQMMTSVYMLARLPSIFHPFWRLYQADWGALRSIITQGKFYKNSF